MTSTDNATPGTAGPEGEDEPDPADDIFSAPIDKLGRGTQHRTMEARLGRIEGVLEQVVSAIALLQRRMDEGFRELRAEIREVRLEARADTEAARREFRAHMDEARRATQLALDEARRENQAGLDRLRHETLAAFDVARRENQAALDEARRETRAELLDARREAKADDERRRRGVVIGFRWMVGIQITTLLAILAKLANMY